MKNNFSYLAILFGILALTSAQGCRQIINPDKELTYIEDVSYNPQTQTALFTVQHTDGCNSHNYEYKYQVLNIDVEQKSAELALFVDTNNECKNKEGQIWQFIKMSLPELPFRPQQLIFKSDKDKEIIITSLSLDILTTSQIELEPQQEIASIEDANYDSETKMVTLKIFLSHGCGGDYAPEYKILSSDVEQKSASLALIVNAKDKCDRGDYTTVEIPLPKLPFKPEKLVFPSSERKKIVLKIT